MARDALPPEETLEGELDRVHWESPKGDFFVASLTADGTRQRVVGELSGAKLGERIKCFGRWVDDPKYGRQFRVAYFVPVLPSSPAGIERYLVGVKIKGIGKKTVQRLVEHFGVETLDVITGAPERLTEVAGLNAAKALLLREAFVVQRASREVMVFLHTHGLGPGLARRVYRVYGDAAIRLIQENPYQLARDVHGIGFRIADLMGRSLGYDLRSPQRAAGATLHVLESATEDGHLYLPVVELARRAEKLEVEADALVVAVQQLAETGDILVEGEGQDAAIYLPRHYRAELSVADRLERLLHTPGPALYSSAEVAIASFESRTGLRLAEGQTAAVARALASKVFVLTGGPGTGKTTLIKAIIALTEGCGLKVLLAAPTGRAAKRLEEASGLAARTIHRLLEFSPRTGGFTRNEERPLAVDTLIVDESSMIDLALFDALIKALPPNARLVLVGDVDQLPSVGAGDVLRDIIGSGVVPVARLTEIFRQSGQSAIVESAHRVNRGELPDPGEGDTDFFHVERPDSASAAQTILELVRERIPKRYGFDPLWDVQVLAPMYKGNAGVERLNMVLQSALNPPPAGGPTPEELLLGAGRDERRRIAQLRVGDKVLQLRNNYDKDVFNGDIGRVAEVDDDDDRVVVSFEGKAVTYEGDSIEELQLAYALSVHKSQGSEYPVVVLSLQKEHFPMLQRNLLYTALTRGKKLVVVVGARRALELAVQNAKQRERYSKLAERLRARVFAQERE